MKKLLSLFCASLCLFAATSALAQEDPAPPPVQITPHIVATPDAAHPQARVDHIDAASHTVCFAWLDDTGNAVDSGNSIATYTTADEAAPPTDAELITAITAAAPSGD